MNEKTMVSWFTDQHGCRIKVSCLQEACLKVAGVHLVSMYGPYRKTSKRPWVGRPTFSDADIELTIKDVLSGKKAIARKVEKIPQK